MPGHMPSRRRSSRRATRDSIRSSIFAQVRAQVRTQEDGALSRLGAQRCRWTPLTRKLAVLAEIAVICPECGKKVSLRGMNGHRRFDHDYDLDKAKRMAAGLHVDGTLNKLEQEVMQHLDTQPDFLMTVPSITTQIALIQVHRLHSQDRLRLAE